MHSTAVITPAEIRKLALAMPEAVESSHFDVADFRIRKKIFATIHPTGKTGVLLHIDPDQRAALAADDPETYQLRGTALQVVFARVKKSEYKALLEQAWLMTAPGKVRLSWTAQHRDGGAKAGKVRLAGPRSTAGGGAQVISFRRPSAASDRPPSGADAAHAPARRARGTRPRAPSSPASPRGPKARARAR